jgi:hypothetical protein
VLGLAAIQTDGARAGVRPDGCLAPVAYNAPDLPKPDQAVHGKIDSDRSDAGAQIDLHVPLGRHGEPNLAGTGIKAAVSCRLTLIKDLARPHLNLRRSRCAANVDLTCTTVDLEGRRDSVDVDGASPGVNDEVRIGGLTLMLLTGGRVRVSIRTPPPVWDISISIWFSLARLLALLAAVTSMTPSRLARTVIDPAKFSMSRVGALLTWKVCSTRSLLVLLAMNGWMLKERVANQPTPPTRAAKAQQATIKTTITTIHTVRFFDSTVPSSCS